MVDGIDCNPPKTNAISRLPDQTSSSTAVHVPAICTIICITGFLFRSSIMPQIGKKTHLPSSPNDHAIRQTHGKVSSWGVSSISDKFILKMVDCREKHNVKHIHLSSIILLKVHHNAFPRLIHQRHLTHRTAASKAPSNL